MNIKKSVRVCFLFTLNSFILFVCCRKLPADAQKEKENQFRSFIQNHRFKTTAFYSDKPIDYIENDSVIKQETELWPYVKEYIKDDKYLISSQTGVVIEQNAMKMPGNDSVTLTRPYSLSSDAQRVYFDFIDYDYNARRYTVQEFKDNYIIIYIDWTNGAKVFTKFEKAD